MIKKFFLLLFKTKWIFTLPKKRELLIYDKASLNSNFVKILFKKKKFEVLHTRYESVNILVLLKTVYKYGFINIIENYKKNFFSLVEPKIIYTTIDSSVSFYKLKNIYPNAKYIVDQRGISKVTGATWPNKFFWDIKKYNKLNKTKAKVDILFVFGSNEKKRLQDIINGNYFVLGNTKNNAYHSNLKLKKKREITYICSGLWEPSWTRQCQTFKLLNKYCYKKNIKLNFLPKRIIGKTEFDEKYYRKKLGEKNWKYLDHSNLNIYKHLLTQELVVFAHSTLGFEVMAKGIKVAILSNYFPEKMSKRYYSNDGLFWTSKTDYVSLAKLFDRMLRIKKSSWNKIYRKFSYEIMFYDKNNLKKKRIINSIIKRI